MGSGLAKTRWPSATNEVGHIVCKETDSPGEDVLAQAEDGGGQGAVLLGELLQGVSHLECLLKLPLLVHVDCLEEVPAGEDYGVVLVLGLALSQDGVAGQADAV